MTHKTGNTFRLILAALHQASEGSPCIVTCQTDADVVRIRKATVKLANTYLTPDFMTHAFGEKYMMANGGTLMFLTREEFDAMDVESFKPGSCYYHDP